MTPRPPLPRGSGSNLRAELVAAAAHLLLGPAEPRALSLRAIARRCGVTPSAVYRQFASQAELTAAVVVEQFARLRSALDDADPRHAPPSVRIEALAMGYVQWAIDHPASYQILFERPDDEASLATGPGLDLLDRLADLLILAGTPPDRSDDRAITIWCALHGVASLRIHKPDAPWTSTSGGHARAMVAALAGTA